MSLYSLKRFLSPKISILIELKRKCRRKQYPPERPKTENNLLKITHRYFKIEWASSYSSTLQSKTNVNLKFLANEKNLAANQMVVLYSNDIIVVFITSKYFKFFLSKKKFKIFEMTQRSNDVLIICPNTCTITLFICRCLHIHVVGCLLILQRAHRRRNEQSSCIKIQFIWNT